jgi:arginine N-succinyltransferase
VIAEMRGVADDNALPPFWQWLQTYFFNIDFPTADHLIGIGNKGFIADLMPRHPIYVSLLPESAQKVIGEVHENTKPALKLLENEGFIHRGYVDLFDAGPTVEAQLKQIKSVRQSHRVQVQIVADHELTDGRQHLAICNCETANFRATFTAHCQVDAEKHLLYVNAETAAALLVQSGDSVRYLILDKGAQ